MTSEQAKTWLRDGRLFIRDGWFSSERGERHHVAEGELYVKDGYLCFSGPPPTPYQGRERRCGRDRREQR